MAKHDLPTDEQQARDAVFTPEPLVTEPHPQPTAVPGIETPDKGE